jgi:hypothetical protein
LRTGSSFLGGKTGDGEELQPATKAAMMIKLNWRII